DRGVQKLRIGWEGDVLGLHGGIDRDPRQILRPQRPALVRHPQAFGQEKFQLAAEALAPMAQVRALVRKLVLEELLSGEVLEVWIIDPAFAHAFVGQSVNMLEQKKPDHKNCVAIPGRPPSLYSGAISPSMNSQSILPASCTSSCLMLMIWSSRARSRSADPVISCFFGRIAPSDAATESCFSIRGNRENEFASFQGIRHGNLAISIQQSRQKTTLAQWVRTSSRPTKYFSAKAVAFCRVLSRVGAQNDNQLWFPHADLHRMRISNATHRKRCGP